MADDEEVFSGFPDCLDDGFTPLPNTWFDILMQIDNLAELKTVLYVMRHTWGYQKQGERERFKKISLDEFAYGRKRRDGSRMDSGTKLAMSTIQEGIKRATDHEYLIFDTDYSDLGRVKKYYGLKLLENEEEEETNDYRNPVVDSRKSVIDRGNPVGCESDSGDPTEKETTEDKPEKDTKREDTALDAHTLNILKKTNQFVRERESVTLLEIEHFLHRYMNTTGKEEVRLILKNVIVWTRISSEFYQILIKLQTLKCIVFELGNEDMYPENKKHPRLPVTYELEDHEEKHWCPMVIKAVKGTKDPF